VDAIAKTITKQINKANARFIICNCPILSSKLAAYE